MKPDLTQAQRQILQDLTLWRFDRRKVAHKIADRFGLELKDAVRLVDEELDKLRATKQAIRDALRIAVLQGVERRFTYLRLAVAKEDYRTANQIEAGILDAARFFGADKDDASPQNTSAEIEVKERIKKLLGVDKMPGEQ